MNKNILLAGGLVGVVIVGLLSYFILNRQAVIKSINSYESCVKAGYPVLETFPSQCKTPDGRTFVNGAEVTPTATVNMANPASANCVKIGGSLTIVTESNGQVGYCSLPSGRICEEWALFNGKCK